VAAVRSLRGARPLVGQHLLGFGVLLLTLMSGYMASRMTGAHEVPRVTMAPAGLHSHIRAVATRYGVSEELIAAIIEAESGFNPRAVSRRGAQGLMQLMPATAVHLGVGDPFNPRENIDGGVRHLLSLLDRFDNDLPLALAAYNAGERAVINYRGIPPYRQTRQYVKRILRRLDNTPRDQVGLASTNRWIW
jgi:soluble lytic murein transglycosylase-like protein